MRRLMSVFVFITAFCISRPSHGATPVARPLEARFQQPPDDAQRWGGYDLSCFGQVYLRSLNIVIVELLRINPVREGKDTYFVSKGVGLLAIEQETGRAIQLTWPVPQGDAIPPEFGVSEVVPLDGYRCGVVLERYSNDDRAFSGPTSTYLYEWDIPRGELRCVSPWELHLTKLLSILDLSQCSLCWDKPRNADWTGEAQVKDLLTGSTANFRLDTGYLYQSSPIASDQGEWFAPADTPTSFVLCRSRYLGEKALGQAELTCFDPLTPTGRRWNLGPEDFRSWLHVSGEWILPLPTSQRPSARLQFYAEIRDSNRLDFDRALLLIDTQTGAFVDYFPVDDLPYFYPIVSPAGRRIVYAPVPWEEPLFVLMDLERGETYELDEFFMNDSGAKPIAFLNEHQFVAAGSQAIWLFECGGARTVTEVFRLDGNRWIPSETTPRWRHTVRFPDRKETWTHKPKSGGSSGDTIYNSEAK